MSPKTTKMVYWSLTGLLCAFFTFDAIGGVMQVPAGQESLRQLGYPMYVLTMVGVSKLLGVVGLLQPKFKTLKEWTYAGFIINVIGAALSWMFVRGPVFNVILPLIFLGLILTSYRLWKKMIAMPKNVV